jgi:hypothetical protein
MNGKTCMKFHNFLCVTYKSIDYIPVIFYGYQTLLLMHSHSCYFLLVDGTGTNLLLLLVLFYFILFFLNADIGWLQKDGRGSIEMC